MIALLLAAACVCPPAPAALASRKTNAEFAAKRRLALERLQKEMDAILERSRP